MTRSLLLATRSNQLNFIHMTSFIVRLEVVINIKLKRQRDSPFGFMNTTISRFAHSLMYNIILAWTGPQIKVPVKFIVGDQDIPYNFPGMKLRTTCTRVAS